VANPNPEREQDEWDDGEGKDDRYILVVGFTKENAYQFVRIRQNKEGSIYVGFAYRGQKAPYFSYHASGETHTVYINENGKKIYSDKKQVTPLAQFHDAYSLGSWAIISPDFSYWKELAQAKRKIQALFCFDMSRLSGKLTIAFDLLESERFDLLSKMTSEIPSNLNPQILVITATNPWIVIRAMNV